MWWLESQHRWFPNGVSKSVNSNFKLSAVVWLSILCFFTQWEYSVPHQDSPSTSHTRPYQQPYHASLQPIPPPLTHFITPISLTSSVSSSPLLPSNLTVHSIFITPLQIQTPWHSKVKVCPHGCMVQNSLRDLRSNWPIVEIGQTDIEDRHLSICHMAETGYVHKCPVIVSEDIVVSYSGFRTVQNSLRDFVQFIYPVQSGNCCWDRDGQCIHWVAEEWWRIDMLHSWDWLYAANILSLHYRTSQWVMGGAYTVQSSLSYLIQLIYLTCSSCQDGDRQHIHGAAEDQQRVDMFVVTLDNEFNSDWWSQGWTDGHMRLLSCPAHPAVVVMLESWIHWGAPFTILPCKLLGYGHLNTMRH